MTDNQREMLEEGCAQLESRAGLVWGPEYIDEFAAAIRAALAEIDRLRADLAQRTADFGNARAERDVARWEIIEGLKEMHTTYGLRRELKRRGWWDWYKEAKP